MQTVLFSLATAALLSCLCLKCPRACCAEQLEESALLDRSLVAKGDTGRLQRALAKARRGEEITVAVIGGSITAGAKASKPERRYGNLLAQWWRERFPAATVKFVNAGIGATGSNYGALRAKRDLLSGEPDFVVVEYGVNDGNSQACAETLEGLVRQILVQPNRPAVVLLFMMHRNGSNAQEWHGKVGAHYNLPMVSFRDALWPEIEAGRLAWDDVMADQVHPNDRGHRHAARFVIALLQRVFTGLPADEDLLKIDPLPPPLLSDLFEHAALHEAADLKPVVNDGWRYDDTNPWTKGWVSGKPGSVLEFEVEGQAILMMEFHVRGPMGKARVQIDDLPPAVVDAWFDQTWGGWRCTHELARRLAPDKHRVRLEILEEKNPQSDGREFRLLGLGAAGVGGEGR